MDNKLKRDYFGWIGLAAALLILIEIVFFNEGIIFSIFVSGAMIYFGRKMMPKGWGRLLFWGGLLSLAASLIGMLASRLFLLAILVYFIHKYTQSKKEPQMVKPVFNEPNGSEVSESMIIEQKPLFSNTGIGSHRTPQHAYEWNDVNIINGIGDIVIDLSNTVLPKGEAVIFIRNMVGSIKIFVPYDVEINLCHTSLAGAAEVLDYRQERSFNQRLDIQTPSYNAADEKVRIFTSNLVGDIEVKRI